MSRFVVLLVLTAGPVWAAEPANAVSNPLKIEWPVILTQLPVSTGDGQADSNQGMLRGDYGDGARIVRIDPDGSRRVLTGGFDSACDPDVAFDGSRFLFAGKRLAGDVWNIFEMTISDLSIRQITDGAGNCRSPIYQSTLFTLDSPEPWYQLTFVSDAAGTRNEDGRGTATHLYSCKLDGSTVRRLTYNLSSDFDPFLMQDGRLLFSSWQRSTFERGARGRVRLFGVNLDGTDYALFADPTGPAIQHMPCITPSGWVVFVAGDQIPWDGSGQLAAVSYRRPLRTFRMLTDGVQGLYHSPSPSPDGAVLVARRPADGTGTHGVGRFDLSSGRWQAIFDDPDWHDIQPRAVYRRPAADGRSSVVREERPNGKLYCLDVHLTDFEQSDWMPAGSVKRVRVLEGVPVAGEGGDAAPASSDWPPLTARRILGEAEVSADGSFQLEVPANLPLELQTLDADGLALRTCSWIWVKNNENRGCIGCHEDGELSPDNRFVDALSLQAIRLTPPTSERRSVDFRRDLMPIIRDRCVPCHGAEQAEPHLDGSLQVLNGQSAGAGVNRDYASLLAREATDDPNALMGRYVQPGRARTSPLIWHLLGRNTARPWDGAASERPAKPIPPGQVEPLTNEQKQMFIEWIDLGAPWGETTDR
jgi:hypothetical protein